MALSSADHTYLNAMMAHEKASIQIAKTYLASGAAGRNANLSDMARASIKDDMAEMAQMASMMGGTSMSAQSGMV